MDARIPAPSRAERRVTSGTVSAHEFSPPSRCHSNRGSQDLSAVEEALSAALPIADHTAGWRRFRDTFTAGEFVVVAVREGLAPDALAAAGLANRLIVDGFMVRVGAARTTAAIAGVHLDPVGCVEGPGSFA
jgi:hypothetical protein